MFKKKLLLVLILGLSIVGCVMLIMTGRGEYLKQLTDTVGVLVGALNGLVAWHGIARETTKPKRRVRTRSGTPLPHAPSSQLPGRATLSHALAPSFESAVYGGLVGGALAGLSIGLLYCLTVDPNANRLIMLPLIFTYGCVVGYCAGAAIEFTGSRFLQLVA